MYPNLSVRIDIYKTMKFNIVQMKFVFALLCGLSFAVCLPAGGALRQRFDASKSIRYNITFNGIPSGHIDWRYLGREEINGKEVEVLEIDAKTEILKLLNLVSSEKIYLDVSTNLPVKVKRDVKLFGRKEIIKESYDQEKGEVEVVKGDGEEITETEVYTQEPPIHNILELLYFFPDDIDLESKQGQWMEFNLPTQKVQVRFHSKRDVAVAGERKEAYFLEGRGARRFNLWLCQKDRLPLRIDFLSWVGRVRIRKEG